MTPQTPITLYYNISACRPLVPIYVIDKSCGIDSNIMKHITTCVLFLCQLYCMNAHLVKQYCLGACYRYNIHSMMECRNYTIIYVINRYYAI